MPTDTQQQPGEVASAVLAYLATHGNMPAGSTAEQLDLPYLDAGVIDSMGIVELIVHFEREYGIRFTPRELQSRDFRTAAGLASIIERLRGAQ